jgi:RNA polymerase sigma-70 factor (ECF subfamily)
MHCLKQAPSMAIEKRPEGFDPDSFDSLVRNYETRLLRVAYRITGQREDAEDVVQETFLR